MAADGPVRASRLPAGIPAVWLCADMNAAPMGSLLERVRAVIAAIDVCVWLRPSASTPTSTVLSAARDLMHASANGSSRVVVGDRIDVAIAVGAHGVHLGGQSVSPLDARRVIAAAVVGAEAVRPFVSVAVHDAAGVAANAMRVDVLVASPLRAVPGKGPPLDVGGLAALIATAPAKPFIALGGILTAEHARDAARAGATGFALRRVLFESGDPAASCRSLFDAFSQHRGSRVP